VEIQKYYNGNWWLRGSLVFSQGQSASFQVKCGDG
jgi:hypothetical protein